MGFECTITATKPLPMREVEREPGWKRRGKTTGHRQRIETLPPQKKKNLENLSSPIPKL